MAFNFKTATSHSTSPETFLVLSILYNQQSSHLRSPTGLNFFFDMRQEMVLTWAAAKDKMQLLKLLDGKIVVKLLKQKI
jgi:hypothetical protein